MLEDAQMDLVEVALSWLEQGQRVALATVTATAGSSPRPVGSQLLAREDGAFVGSVSGGCVEAAVITAAQEVIRSAKPQRLHFGAAEDDVLGVGLACGGQIDILISVPERAALDALLKAWKERLPTCLTIGAQTGRWQAVSAHALGPAGFERAFTSGHAYWLDAQPEALFVRPYLPPRRLIIIGAVHIAQALASMARVLGMQVTIVDPRQAFASPGRFPDATLVRSWPAEALAQLGLDESCAVVALTHDTKIDDPALRAALDSQAFYVGALGSRKTHAARLERLRQHGCSELQLSRIHGPIGLAIGAISPAEIAVSIVAEITERSRKGPHHHFSAVVLAAGMSTRAGGVNKLLQPIEGQPMLARVVDSVLSSRVADVVVVTGHDAGPVRDCLGTRRVRYAHNSDYAAGISTSIRVGIDAVLDADAACVVLGDMPWLERGHVNALLAAFDPARGSSICVPEVDGRPGNPVLWARQHFAALRALTGDRGARALWESLPTQVCRVAVEGEGIHADCDTFPRVG
jgi:xanthine dehydrogenase accessory factor